jgi:hypothetical protein
VQLSNGEYEAHYIGVNWPHHIFVNHDFTVVGASEPSHLSNRSLWGRHQRVIGMLSRGDGLAGVASAEAGGRPRRERSYTGTVRWLSEVVGSWA